MGVVVGEVNITKVKEVKGKDSKEETIQGTRTIIKGVLGWDNNSL